MVVGIAEIRLLLPGPRSLKEKRRILRSLVDRIRVRYHVAVAEVGDQNLWNRATVGVACVSNEAAHAHQILGHVLHFVESNGEVEVDRVEVRLA
ncbi:DUF503 domain-containing protein [Limnochorda pilosa]|uniref:YlxP-like protein n=1 Tax=Limnochorda pilosa TaxID=1555112 RepID=A0A0K2SL12_LIMPI|nr:DUF503 domain-containing protein [Limnochorda pilosa]BAS27539.1 hypothetical protein LIP_1693 [Limnochorda pilosa]